MERCRLPRSRHCLPSGCLGMRAQHQTSTHGGNILSICGNHANSNTTVQACASCLCLPKRKAKENGHCQKKMPRLWTTIWQRGTLWKTLFQNKPSGTINPVYLPHKTPEQHKECVNQQNTVYFNSCPILYPATYEEHPMNNNDIHRVALALAVSLKR